MTTNPKQYLGDGAYVGFDGTNIILTTEDGISVTNRVVLEPQVLDAFLEYIEKVFGKDNKREMDLT